MIYDVCIIGSGQSGLTTCKTFAEKGYNVIVLEKNAHDNGLFYSIQEKDYFRWSTSRYMSGFSDYPMDKSLPAWFSIQQYIDYLKSYKYHFKLDQYIQYNSHVLQCKQNKKNGFWSVSYKSKTQMVQQLECKKLIVCTGLNQTPKFPDIVQRFSGEVIHTEEVYRRMSELDWQNKFSNKKVLVLGGGESGFDIGHVVTQYADSVYYSTKNYIEWFPSGEELPRNIKRIKKIKHKCLSNDGFSGAKFPTDTHLLYAEYSLPEPMSEFWHNFGRKIILTFAGSNLECGKCSHSHKKLCDINETPENLFKKYVVKRTEFLLDIFEEKVSVVYYPHKIEGRTVYTKEETIEDVDIIVCASGYRKQFPFLDKSVYSGEFIKKIIPKNATNIAFIGFARPTMASIASIAEMQSWWTELYFQNKLNYTIRRPMFRTQDVLNLENDHIDTLVIGCFYMKDLAKDMNLEPNMIRLFFTDFELFHKIYTGSCHPMIYRIHGDKAYPEAREILIDTLPDFDKHSPTSKQYFVMFLIYHLMFIIGCTLVAYIITYVTNILLLMNKVKVSNAFSFNHVFWSLSLIIIFVFYRYF